MALPPPTSSRSASPTLRATAAASKPRSDAATPPKRPTSDDAASARSEAAPLAGREHDAALRGQLHLTASAAASSSSAELRPIDPKHFHKITPELLQEIQLKDLERLAISDLDQITKTVPAEAFRYASIPIKDWRLPDAEERYSRAMATIADRLFGKSDASAAASSSKTLETDGCADIHVRTHMIREIFAGKEAAPIPQLLLSKADDTPVTLTRAVCREEHDQFAAQLERRFKDDDDFAKYFQTQKWFTVGDRPLLNDIGDAAHSHLISIQVSTRDLQGVIMGNFIVCGDDDGKAYRNASQVKSNEPSNIALGDRIFQQLATMRSFKPEAKGPL